ncbi:MAG TPA: redoxin domain-containing protein [Galbitalea sp.]|nr:redoxin domain-containing protein [Galbitalea sp.]
MTRRTTNRERAWPIWVIGTVSAVAIGLAAFSIAQESQADSAAHRSLPISNGMSNLLEVNPLITLDTKAPALTLTDQNGHPESLESFAGKAVILTFGDDKCTDLCTLLAEDVISADRDLGKAASNVQFVSINANTFYPSVSDTKQWTDTHGLKDVSNWHFLTGSPSTLTALARKYGVDVELDHKNKTIVHGTDMFFIDPSGHEEQIGQFGVESANTALFAHAMAQLAIDTIPNNASIHIAGPSPTSSKSVSTALGRTAPAIELPELGTGTPLSTATYRGKWVVLNFWSSTCAICYSEMPGLEKASDSAGEKAVVLGIDVSDVDGPAESFLKRTGVTFPTMSDPDGVVAGQYLIPGTPYTVILDPNGKVAVRHPGSITAEQLEYLLDTLETQNPTS